jgi:MoaA/NifB/PqqE/SkfB family radical SAM enzyme
MSYEEVEKLFQKYQEMKVPNIWLFGGEPTLREDVIKLADRYFPLMTIISNGQIKVKENYKSARIHVSIDGLEDENDYIRGKGSFQKIVDNYEGDKRVIFNITVNHKNVVNLDETIAFLKELRTKGVEFQLFSKSRDMNKYDEALALSEEDMVLIKDTLTKYHYDPKVFVAKGIVNSWVYNTLQNKCQFTDLIDCYASDGKQKQCCTPGIDCEECKMFPPHFIEAFNSSGNYMTKLKLWRWL